MMTIDIDNPSGLVCTLTPLEVKQRRAEMRKKLLPSVISYHLEKLSLELTFSDEKSIRDELEQFVSLEQQCCGFLDFTISSSDSKLTLNIQGPSGSESTLMVFADAVSVCS